MSGGLYRILFWFAPFPSLSSYTQFRCATGLSPGWQSKRSVMLGASSRVPRCGRVTLLRHRADQQSVREQQLQYADPMRPRPDPDLVCAHRAVAVSSSASVSYQYVAEYMQGGGGEVASTRLYSSRENKSTADRLHPWRAIVDMTIVRKVAQTPRQTTWK